MCNYTLKWFLFFFIVNHFYAKSCFTSQFFSLFHIVNILLQFLSYFLICLLSNLSLSVFILPHSTLLKPMFSLVLYCFLFLVFLRVFTNCLHINKMWSKDKNQSQYEFACSYYMWSVESQKGVYDVQRCSIENQKGTIAVQCLQR